VNANCNCNCRCNSNSTFTVARFGMTRPLHTRVGVANPTYRAESVSGNAGLAPDKMARAPDTLLMTIISSRLAQATLAVTASLLLGGCATPGVVPVGDRSALACTLPSNCVDSLGMGGLAPLKYRGTPEQALARLEATLKTFAEAQIVRREALAVQIIFTTPQGFRDQVDFQIDPTAKRIDFRSRSLLGLFDFGKNRSRMQAFALRFQALA